MKNFNSIIAIIFIAIATSASAQTSMRGAASTLEIDGSYCDPNQVATYYKLRSIGSAELKNFVPMIPLCIIDPKFNNNHKSNFFGGYYTQGLNKLVLDVEQHYGEKAGVDVVIFMNEIIYPLFHTIMEQKKGDELDYARGAVIIENAMNYAGTKSYSALYMPFLKKMHGSYLQGAR